MPIPKLKVLTKHPYNLYASIACGVLLIVLVVFLVYHVQRVTSDQKKLAEVSTQSFQTQQQLTTTQKELTYLKNQDQYKINQQNTAEINNIEQTYKKASSTYEDLVDLKTKSKDTAKLDDLYALILKQLADKNYASANATLTDLSAQITDQNDKIAAALQTSQSAPSSSANVPASNTPPGSGFSQQKVSSDVGDFVVDVIAADLSSTRVIVDTASDSDCNDNCPVMSLSDYVSRNGAYAGINGTYFCPSTYPSCAGKTNSFDLLVMNKNKHYFNSDNNVYSTNPAVIFSSGSVRFVSRALEWGRDTSVDAVISNYPLLVFNDQIVFGGSDDAKMTGKGARNFVASKGNTVYIGIVYNATMTESAHVLKSMGMQNAMNLDEGGSTALWYGGYKAGPGRNLPNALLFVRK